MNYVLFSSLFFDLTLPLTLLTSLDLLLGGTGKRKMQSTKFSTLKVLNFGKYFRCNSEAWTEADRDVARIG
jgi:hypothetical protein